MAAVRKRLVLTISQKLEILERLEKGESGVKLAATYGVGTSTISDLKKKKEALLKYASKTERGPGKRKTLKKAKFTDVEDALHAWFVEERGRGAAITEVILTERAKILYKNMRGDCNFLASKGWLDRFKLRHGIRLSNSAEKSEKGAPELSRLCHSELIVGSFEPETELEVTLRCVDSGENGTFDGEGTKEEEEEDGSWRGKGAVTHLDAFKCFQKCIQWAEENGCSFPDVVSLRRMQEKCFEMRSRKSSGMRCRKGR